MKVPLLHHLKFSVFQVVILQPLVFQLPSVPVNYSDLQTHLRPKLSAFLEEGFRFYDLKRSPRSTALSIAFLVNQRIKQTNKQPNNLCRDKGTMTPQIYQGRLCQLPTQSTSTLPFFLINKILILLYQQRIQLKH